MKRQKTIRDRIQRSLQIIETGFAEREYDYSDTPLHDAVRDGNIAAIEGLIATGADINSKEQIFGETPLCAATNYGNIEVVKFLITAGADPNLTDSSGNTPLHYCSGDLKYAILDVLVLAEINADTIDDSFALHTCAIGGNVETAKKLIDAGANFDLYESSPNFQHTPLLEACSHKQYEVMKVLISAGANVNLPNEQGETVLFDTVRDGNADLVKIIIDANAELDLYNKFNQTPLHIATRLSEIEILKLLIHAGASVNLRNGSGETALDIAMEAGNRQSVEILKKFSN